ncbi:MAG: hypothetical protein V3T31_13650, partial [candidate division Zixibacteria bacterium]
LKVIGASSNLEKLDRGCDGAAKRDASTVATLSTFAGSGAQAVNKAAIDMIVKNLMSSLLACDS